MEKCAACDKAVYPLEMVKACNKSWHKLCFRCKECNMVLSLKAFAAINDDPYCKPHYMKLFHSKGNYDAFGGEGALARSGTGYTGMGFSGVGKVPANRLSLTLGVKRSDTAKAHSAPGSPAEVSRSVHHQITSAPTTPVLSRSAGTPTESEPEAAQPQPVKPAEEEQPKTIEVPLLPAQPPAPEKKEYDAPFKRRASLLALDLETAPVAGRSAPEILSPTSRLQDKREAMRREAEERQASLEEKLAQEQQKQQLEQQQQSPSTPEVAAAAPKSAPVPLRTSTSMRPPSCAACGKSVYPLEQIQACGKNYHKLCFRCKDCNMVLSLKGFAAINDEPYCKPHYMKLFHSKGNYSGFTDENARSGSTYTGAAFMGMSQVASLSTSSKSLSGSSSPVTRPRADSPQASRASPAPVAAPVEQSPSQTPAPEPAVESAVTPTPTPTPTPEPAKAEEKVEQTPEVEKVEEAAPVAKKEPEVEPVAAPATATTTPHVASSTPSTPTEPAKPLERHEMNGHAKSLSADSSPVTSPSVQSLVKAAGGSHLGTSGSQSPVPEGGRSPSMLGRSGISRPPPCAVCLKGVYPLEQIQACNKTYHKLCFRCKDCHMVLSLKAFATINDEPYCKPHYMKLFHSKGNYAGFTDENARSGSTYTGAAFMGMSQVAALSTSGMGRTPPGSPAPQQNSPAPQQNSPAPQQNSPAPQQNTPAQT